MVEINKIRKQQVNGFNQTRIVKSSTQLTKYRRIREKPADIFGEVIVSIVLCLSLIHI